MANTSDTAPTKKLICGQCNHENEAERVYCHSCGEKLDRSLLPKIEDQQAKEKPEKARKRISKMTNPGSGGALREIKMAFWVLFYSSILAALFLISQKPDDVPEVAKVAPDRLVANDMLDAIEAPQPQRLDFTEAEINAHLYSILRRKDGAMSGLEFKRAYVNLLPGAIRIGSEQSLFGYPLYSNVIYRLEVKAGKFEATMLGGNFGRLALHPQIMRRADFFFQKLWTVLSRERKQMDEMRMVILQKGKLTLVTKGKTQ